MTNNRLKLLALICMTIDHIGVILFPDLLILRIIGRLAFPIFAFLLVEGFKHTKNLKNYMIRLLAFAFVSEIIFDVAFYGSFSLRNQSNIFFTLLFGLYLLHSMDSAIKGKRNMFGLLADIIIVLTMSTILHVDYGIYGILTIVIFYLCNFKKSVMMLFLLNLIYIGSFHPIQILCLLALVPIYFYNGERGKKLKKINMYVYYPAHLLLLLIISKVML